MPNYVKKALKFLSRGIGLRHPPDLLPDGLYPALHNMIARDIGGLQLRPGISAVTAFSYPDPVHSIRRLNDPTDSSSARIVGAGTSVYDTTSSAAVDTGYSGSPLSMVPFRPNQSPRPWMYISDASRSRKIRTDRTNYAVGIVPPSSSPAFSRGVPNFIEIDNCEATTGWAVSGTAGALSTPNRYSTTISAILYDSGTSGWCSIKPAAMDANYQPGAFIILGTDPNTENTKIRQVFEPITDTTIASILYDSGTTGLCSIVLTKQSTGLQPDALVYIASSEYVRVLSVSEGVDGQVSFRCSTTGARVAGNAVAGVASFRTYTYATFAAADPLVGKVLSSTLTSGTGWIYRDDHTSPRNYATYGNRPFQPDDYIHISIQVDHPENITQGRIIFNTDSTFPSDFTLLKNALYKDFSASVFQPVVNSALTDFVAQQNAIQRSIIESTATSTELPLLSIPSGDPVSGLDISPDAPPVADQTIPGTSAWTELNFKVSELSLAGSSQIASLASVSGIIIQLQVTASTVLLIDSLWIGGSYGPDSRGTTPYRIYQRYRSSLTGARSNPSPIMRTPIDLQRERGIITPVVSSDPQVDMIDLFSLGGNLTLPTLIASVPNTATAFNYDASDASVAVNELLEFDRFQPFPVTDLPRSGACTVSGTSVKWASGDTFNTAWQAGSLINIGGSIYTLWASPSSTTRLELVENAGNLSPLGTGKLGYLAYLTSLGWTPERAVLFDEGSGAPHEHYTGAEMLLMAWDVGTAAFQPRAFTGGDTQNWTTIGGHVGLTAPLDAVAPHIDGWAIPGPAISYMLGNPETIIVVRAKSDTTLRQASLFGVYQGDWEQAYAPWDNGTVYCDYGYYGSAQNRVTWGGWTPNTNTEAWAFRGGSLGLSIWLNGVKVASHVAVPDGGGNTSNHFEINCGSAEGDKQTFFFVALIHGEVSDAVLATVTPDNILGAGAGGGTFSIPEATLGGIPLPALWGPDPITGVMFGCGTSKEAGTLYWTNPNDPDSASDANQLPITAPSEPLRNGFMYDGRCYVASSERLFNCYPQTLTDPTSGKQVLTYVAQEIPNGSGLFGIYAFTVGDNIYLVTRDGILQIGGGGMISITDETLYPLFPHQGAVGTSVNGYYPISFSSSNTTRLFRTKNALYFVYLDTNSAYQVMLYDLSLPQPGWFPLTFTPTARVIYEEEGAGLTSVLMGGSDGKIYQLGQGTSDAGSAIAFDFYTPSFDLGDPRLQKLFLDYMLDADLQNVTTTITPYANNLLTALTAATPSWTGRTQLPITLITSPLALYRNIGFRFQGSSSTATPKFYEIEPNAVIQPYLAVNMTSPHYLSHGFTSYGHLRDGYFVYISTSTITVTILTDLGLTYSFTLSSSSGAIQKTYVPLSALKGLLFYYSATSTSPFALFTDETVVRVKEWGSSGPYQSFKPFAGQSA